MESWLSEEIQRYEDKFHDNLAKSDLLEAQIWLNMIRPYTWAVKKNTLDKANFRFIIAKLELELEKAKVNNSSILTKRGIKNARIISR
jgi:hypothetical protein